MPGPSIPYAPADWTTFSTRYGYGPSLASSFRRALTAALKVAAAREARPRQTRTTVSPTVASRIRKSDAAVTTKSRTLVARNVRVRPSAEAAIRSPVLAKVIGTSVWIRTVTRGLTGVTNGSPWLGRSNRRPRLIHGIQRCMSTIPLARVNSQFEPLRVDRSRAANGTTTVAVAPSGSVPPSGTTMVWSSMRGLIRFPSTVTVPRSSAPRRAMTVLSSRRSMPAPDRFWAVILTVPRRRRAATESRTFTSYVALIARLVRLTAPGTMAVDAATATLPGAAGPLVASVAWVTASVAETASRGAEMLATGASHPTLMMASTPTANVARRRRVARALGMRRILASRTVGEA